MLYFYSIRIATREERPHIINLDVCVIVIVCFKINICGKQCCYTAELNNHYFIDKETFGRERSDRNLGN